MTDICAWCNEPKEDDHACWGVLNFSIFKTSETEHVISPKLYTVNCRDEDGNVKRALDENGNDVMSWSDAADTATRLERDTGRRHWLEEAKSTRTLSQDELRQLYDSGKDLSYPWEIDNG